MTRNDAVSLGGYYDMFKIVAILSKRDNTSCLAHDRAVRMWDALTRSAVGEPIHRRVNSVLSAAISPDGKRIISGSDDGTIRKG